MDARQNISKKLTHYVPIETRTDRIVKCVAKLSENMTEPYNLIMVDMKWRKKGFRSTWKFRNVSLVLYMDDDDNLQKIVNFKRMNNFMLLLDNITRFQEWLIEVHTFDFWNPKGKFIVAMLAKDNVTEILQLAWKYYIVNINVILLFDMVPLVYTYYPYETDDCINHVYPELVMKCDEDLPQNLYPNKIPRTYHGCGVKLLAYKMPPYVINPYGNPHDAYDVGLEVIIMKTFADVLNFTEVYVPHNYTSWGASFPNGSYSEMLNAIYHRQADVMFGLAPYTEVTPDFDYTTTHIVGFLTWWVPAAREEPGWKNLLLVFEPIVWLCICFSCGISTVLWWIIGRTRERSHHFSTVSGTLLANFYIGLQGAVPQPKGNIMRFVFIGTTFYSMIMYTAHQSQLIGSLTTPRFEHQISNIDELLESGLSYGFSGPVAAYLTEMQPKHYRTLLDNYIKCPLTEECLNRTAFKRDFAVVKNIRQTIYMIKKYYTKSDGTSMIYGFPDVTSFFPRYIVPKGFPMLRQFNKLIMRLQSNGLICKWDKEVTGTVRRVPAAVATQSLTMSHLASGFLYLLVGYMVSCIAFIIEIFYYKCQSRQKLICNGQ